MNLLVWIGCKLLMVILFGLGIWCGLKAYKAEEIKGKVEFLGKVNDRPAYNSTRQIYFTRSQACTLWLTFGSACFLATMFLYRL